MEYDKERIGERIRDARKSFGLTQVDLAGELNLSLDSRQTISKWENGKMLPHLEYLVKMCELFNCELGYLLCDPQYNYKTKLSSFIGEQLNLSENSVKKLLRFGTYENEDTAIILDKLIQHDEFEDFLRSILLHVSNYNENNYWSDKDTIESLSKTLNCKPTETKEYAKKSSESVMSSRLVDIVDCIYLTKDNVYKKRSNVHNLFKKSSK